MISIFAVDPSDWKDLELKVSKIFADIGFSVEVEKDISLVRGKVNVDVIAIKKHLTTKEVHIAECKWWSEPIPKQVVHSFRTILSDSGANAGYIISKEGFQKGAHEAAENSNLNLLSFQEFQTEFRTRWLDGVVDELEALGYPLRKFADPMESFFDNYVDKLSDDKKKEFSRLVNKYYNIATKSFRGIYKNLISGQLELDWIEKIIVDNSKDFPKGVKVNCLMDYFQYLKDVCSIGVAEFDAVFGEPLRKN